VRRHVNGEHRIALFIIFDRDSVPRRPHAVPEAETVCFFLNLNVEARVTGDEHAAQSLSIIVYLDMQLSILAGANPASLVVDDVQSHFALIENVGSPGKKRRACDKQDSNAALQYYFAFSHQLLAIIVA